jgi:hypothetical protein
MIPAQRSSALLGRCGFSQVHFGKGKAALSERPSIRRGYPARVQRVGAPLSRRKSVRVLRKTWIARLRTLNVSAATSYRGSALVAQGMISALGQLGGR